MERLIDADSLAQRMYHEVFEKDTDMQKWDSGCWIRYKLFEQVLEQQPTVGASGKGEWLEKEVSEYPIVEWQSAKCSQCGKYHTTPYIYFFNEYEYCPHCGAKMIT